jgi:hypothetical protein
MGFLFIILVSMAYTDFSCSPSSRLASNSPIARMERVQKTVILLGKPWDSAQITVQVIKTKVRRVWQRIINGK